MTLLQGQGRRVLTQPAVCGGHGRDVGTLLNRTVLLLYGVYCEEAREAVSRALEEESGVKEVQVNLYHAEAVIVHDERRAPGDLITAVIAAGFHAHASTPLTPVANLTSSEIHKESQP